MKRDDLLFEIARLLRDRRWAAIATRADDDVLASMVAYVVEPQPFALLLHLSRLAAHTRNLLAHPRVSLVVTEPDNGRGDPQLLPRLTVNGRVEVIAREAPAFAAARQLYVARLPDSAQLFEFPDFVLFRLVPAELRYVGGFARAHSIAAGELEGAFGPGLAAPLGPV